MQSSTQQWKVLRTVSSVLKIFAWIITGVGAIVILATLCTGISGGIASSQSLGGSSAAIGGIGALVVGVLEAVYFGLSALFTFGASELIMLFIAMEENTRASAARVGAGSTPAPAYAPTGSAFTSPTTPPSYPPPPASY